MRETRAATVQAHVLMALRHSGTDQADFADDVASLYHERTPLHARGVEFHQHTRGADPYQVRRANEQLLFRMLKAGGPVRLPVELEEAVVMALPEPYRSECVRELAERYGLLAAALPTRGGCGTQASVGLLAREFGDVLHATAQTFGDGLLEQASPLHCAEVIKQIDQLVACALSLREAHLKGTQP